MVHLQIDVFLSSINFHSKSMTTVYCTDNPFAVGENRYLFFISDVPHLIKTTRNCFANSYSHKKNKKAME